MSGIISDEIANALKKDAETSRRPSRDSGEYEVEVTSVAIADNPTGWIEKALMVEVKYLDEAGGDFKYRLELAPCKDKTGNISPGKIRFLRWQLNALGLDHEEIAFQLFGIIGNKYKVKYTVDNGLNEDGSLKRPNANLNPHTGKPYINRDMVFLEKIDTTTEDDVADDEGDS